MSKIGVGFVGAGWMGGVQLKRLAERDDVEVLALLEPNVQRGKEVLKEVGLPEDILIDDYQKIIDNENIDAVWLVSPNCYHGAQSLEAMKAGKHVFCEKPAATNFHEFCDQIEVARANPKLMTFVDYLLHFDTMEDHLKKMVSDGEFGQITQIQVNYRHPVNIAGDKVWKLNKDVMGDAIGMGIIHSLSVMLSVMSSQAKPVSVFATSHNAGVRQFEADPTWNIQLRFDNGAAGFCFGNIDNGIGYDAYHNLFGTNGGFIFDSQQDRPAKVRLWSEKMTDNKMVFPLDRARCEAEGTVDAAWDDDTTTPDSGDVVNHQTGACIDHFIECIKGGTQSPLSFEGSQAVGEVGWAAQMSAALGRPVDLPLDWEEAKKFFAS